MASIAVLVHPTRPDAAQTARELIAWLLANDHTPLVPESSADVDGLGQYVTDNHSVASGTDLGLSLGGDGTMMRAVRLFADSGVPVLGVNFGGLGYLTEVEPPGAIAAVERFLNNEHSIEERMRVTVRLPNSESRQALNEISIEKMDSGHSVSISVSINEDPFHKYLTDGLIVASPTGSTAYSLSARGPLVAPTHRALIFTPVAPHTLFDRSLVLTPEAKVDLEVSGKRSANVVVDGRVACTLDPGESVRCTAAREPARFVTFGTRTFHEVIKAKFDLNER